MEDKKYKNTTLSDEQAEKKIQEMKHHDLRTIRSVVYFIAVAVGLFISESKILSFVSENGFLDYYIPLIIAGFAVLIFEFFIRRKFPKFDSKKDLKEKDERALVIKSKVALYTLRFTIVTYFVTMIYLDVSGKSEMLSIMSIPAAVVAIFYLVAWIIIKRDTRLEE